uniref:ABC transporter domain-containing protein n=1 Tax=Alexandrium andersonii TaxID=327968 RepID=A0A7S2H6H7_9DINO
MTAREHLTLFARIKGVAPGQLHRYVESMLERLTLRPYADKQARTFSGGTRRKLSLGIALIGDPRCIFLDEPTTGVDPESRRFMWMLISSTMQGRSVILTTHSMDECEALCGRIGIMVNGQLVCLGSAGLLKATHGYGYQFEVAFNAAADLKDAHLRLRSFLEQIYPEGTQCLEGGGGQDALPGAFRQRAKLRLPKGQVPISMIFREVERRRVDLDISEYMISETTLEQLFIQFAEHQRSDEDPPFQPPVLENVGASLASAASTDQASSRSALQVSDSGAAK